MPDEKKKFRIKDLKIGKFLQEKAPKILDIIGDYIPPVEILAELVKKEADLIPLEERELQKALQEYELEIFRAEIEDRASARIREVEIAKTGQHDIMFYISGGVGLTAFLSLIYAIVFVNLPEEKSNLMHLLIGEVFGFSGAIFNYYFGSSKGSRDKDVVNRGV